MRLSETAPFLVSVIFIGIAATEAANHEMIPLWVPIAIVISIGAGTLQVWYVRRRLRVPVVRRTSSSLGLHVTGNQSIFDDTRITGFADSVEVGGNENEFRRTDISAGGRGGKGGDATVGGSGVAIGGKGGDADGLGIGGDGGSAEVEGEGFAAGGEGGGASGKGGRSPFEILGIPNQQLPDGTMLWDKGRGGHGAGYVDPKKADDS